MTTKILKRKNKATDTRLDIILGAIARRYSQRDAARLAGISEKTISFDSRKVEYDAA